MASKGLSSAYDRPFRRGSNRFSFRVSPLAPIEFPFGLLSFRRQTLTRTEDGFSSVGEPVDLAQIDLPASLPEEGFEVDVDLTAPDVGGEFHYEASLDGEFWLFPRAFTADLR